MLELTRPVIETDRQPVVEKAENIIAGKVQAVTTEAQRVINHTNFVAEEKVK